MTISPLSPVGSSAVHSVQRASHLPTAAVQSPVDPDHDGDRDPAGQPDADKSRVNVLA